MRRLAIVIFLLSTFVAQLPHTARAADVASLALSPTVVTGGKTSNALVKLNVAAPTGGQVVSLTSSRTTVATVPASVTVPAGATQAAFTVTSKVVTATTTAVITATGPSLSVSATLTVNPAALLKVSMSPGTIVNTRSGTGTVSLTGPAPSGGIVVALTTSSTLLAVPANVSVPGGASTATFTATAGTATSSTGVTLTARYGGVSKTTTVTVAPLQVASVSVLPANTAGGVKVTLTVNMNGTVLGSPATITLSGGDPAAVNLPSSMTIPAGAKSASATVTTYSVSSVVTLTLRAAYGGSSRTTTLTLNPIGLSSVAVSPTSITGGASATGTVTLSAPAPSGGLAISLKSSNTTVARVPSSVTILAGTTSAKFTVTTSGVTSSTSATIAATLGTITKSTSITIAPVTVGSHSLSASTVVGGQAPVTGTVTLTGAAPSGGIVVTLTPNSSAVTAPGSITIPAGATKGTYSATTSLVQASVVVTNAATDGRTTRSAKLTVNPLTLSAISAPTAPTGGHSVDISVTLNGAASSGGATVSITSSNQSIAAVAGTVTVPAGAISARIPVQLAVVAADTPVTLSATYNGVTKSTTMTVKPAAPWSVSVSPSILAGGNPASVTVTLTGVAPAGGLTVTLASNSASVMVPASIPIAPGALSGQVTIQTSPVTAQTSAAITATAAGGSKSSTLTLSPTKLAGIAPNPAFVVAGGSTTGYVQLSGPAPSGGVTVNLSSATPTIANVPNAVTIAAGSSSAAFTISGGINASQTQSTTITATYGGTSVSVTVGISAVRPTLLSFNPARAIVGQQVSGTVLLSGSAPQGGADIALRCTDAELGIPATVKVNSGSNQATFTFTAGSVSNPSISCSAERNQDVAFATIEVYSLKPAGISLNPTVAEGGQVVTASILLSSPAPAAVTASISNNGGVSTPSSVTIAAGQQSASLAVTVFPTAEQRTVTISVSSGGQTVQATLTVNPPTFNTITLSRTSVGGGSSVSGTVSLSSLAPTGGVAVSIASNNPVASVPASVVIPANSSSATFTVTTSEVTGSDQTAILSAVALAETRTVSLVITPPRLDVLSFDRTVATGGIHSATGTVTMTGIAPAGGFVVSLSSNSPSVSVPASITIPAGATSETFLTTTNDVSSMTPAIISASAGSVTLTATLTVEPLLKSLTLSSAAVTGGTPLIGTVTLSTTAPTNVTVALAASNSAATVPATVVVAAGQTQATFVVSTTPVGSAQSGSVTATLNGYSRSAALTVNPPMLTDLALSVTTVTGGSSSVTGTVTISGPAPSSGSVITLTSSNTAAATVPASVTIPAGGTTATFAIATLVRTTSAQITISAAYLGATITRTLTVNPFSVASVTLSPTSVIGGAQNAIATITINDPAPAGGLVVSLSSSAPTKANVPATVTVPAGSKTTTATVTTFVTTTGTVTITATYNGGSRTASLTVNALGPNTVTLSPASIIGGGGSVTGTVTLNAAAPAGGQVVSLTSNNPAAVVPASVTVAAGQTTATFTMTTSPPTVTASVQVQAAANGKSASATLQLYLVTVNTISATPTAVIGGFANMTGTVTLAAAAPNGGAVVALSSSNSAGSVPASVSIAAGSTSASFSIVTSVVNASTPVTITANAYGSTKSTTVTVNPYTIQSLTVSPSTLIGGVENATATVTINAAAPAGGLVISLSSSSVAASVPASITIAQGAASGTATLATQLVTSTTSVTLTASRGSSSRTEGVTVIAIGPSTLSMSPTSVIGGGGSATGTVTLNAAAPSGGMTVSLVSNNSAVAVPVSIVVPAGQVSATFSATTAPPTATTNVQITASTNDRSANASLTVHLVQVASVSVSPATITGGSGSATGTVTLGSPAPAGGAVVSLSSDDPAAVVPASISIPADSASATFGVSTAQVTTATTVTISAAAYGSSKTGQLSVVPYLVTAISASPSSVLGGVEGGSITVWLSAPAPGGGLVVPLSSDSSAVNAPADITVPAGATSASVAFTTTAVGTPTNVAVMAAYGGSSQSTAVTVQPPAIVSVSASPSAGRSGESITGTVTLSAPAPVGGMVVSLASSDPAAAAVPADVVVAQGQTSATFTIAPGVVSADQAVTISATAGGATITCQFTAQP